MALVRRNLDDLAAILRWNAEHDLELFRIGQSLIPFASHPAFPYNWAEVHSEKLKECGALARSFGMRLSMHPGQFVVPSSQDPVVRERSFSELRYTTRVLDLLGAEDGVIVLHVGGVYGDREGTRSRMVSVLSKEENLLRYLALENDERLWSVEETLGIAVGVGIPMIVDTLHHALNPGKLELSEALNFARETWVGSPHRQTASRQKVHISSQAPERRRGAHSEYIAQSDFKALLSAEDTHHLFDLMVEAKASERAALVVRREISDR